MMKAIELVLSTLFAALPPMEQSSREIQTMLSDPRLQQSLESSSPIQSIERQDQGYLISTIRERVWVEIVYKRSHHPGPIPFDLVFHEPEELR